MKPSQEEIGGGAHHRAFADMLAQNGINTTHLKHSGKGGSRKRCSLSEILIEKSSYMNRQRLKQKLLRACLLEEKCYECGLPPVWNGKPLTLHLDHINGVNNDHRIENLQLLCPNCHTQTPTYAGRNKKTHPHEGAPKKDKCSCGFLKSAKSPYCKACSNKQQERASWPSDEDLRDLVWQKPATHIALDLGVSSPAIKKRCKARGIHTPPRGYWQKKAATHP